MDDKAFCEWLMPGNIFTDAEEFLMQLQYHVIAIQSDICRMWRNTAENLERIPSECQVLASEEYTNRHKNVVKIVHLLLLGYKVQLQKLPTTNTNLKVSMKLKRKIVLG